MFVITSYSFITFVLTYLCENVRLILQKPYGVLSLRFSLFLNRNEESIPTVIG
jgi:hypothetical protein